MKFSILYLLFFLCMIASKSVLGSVSAKCGGILEGPSGRLEFCPLPNPEYLDETCIWIIQSLSETCEKNLVLDVKQIDPASTLSAFSPNTFQDGVFPQGEGVGDVWEATAKWTSSTRNEDTEEKLKDCVVILVLKSTSSNPCVSFSWSLWNSDDVIPTGGDAPKTSAHYLTSSQGLVEYDASHEWFQRMVFALDCAHDAIVDLNITHRYYGCNPEGGDEAYWYNMGILKVREDGDFDVIKSSCGCQETVHKLEEESAPLVIIANAAGSRNPVISQCISWDSRCPEIIEEETTTTSTTTTTTTTTTEKPQTPDHPTYKCGGKVEVTGYKTTLVEYKLGEQYDNFERCTWALTPSTDCDTICLFFEEIELEEVFDAITLYSWDEFGQAYYATISNEDKGTQIPLCYNFKNLLLHFTSDLSITGPGFKVTGYCESSGSGGNPYPIQWWESSGTWKYPGNGWNYYPNYAVEAAFFDPVGSNKKEKPNKMYVDYFDIEHHETCSYDYLMVWELTGPSGGIGRQRICGSSQQPILLTSMDCFLAIFVSDYIETRSGFEMSCVA